MKYTIIHKILVIAMQHNPSFISEIISFESINEDHAKMLREILSGLNADEKRQYASEVYDIRRHQSKDIFYYIASQIEVY